MYGQRCGVCTVVGTGRISRYASYCRSALLLLLVVFLLYLLCPLYFLAVLPLLWHKVARNTRMSYQSKDTMNIPSLLLYVFVVGIAPSMCFAQLRVAHTEHVLPNELGEDPAARAAWEYERERDPQSGVIPSNIKARELEFSAQLPVRSPIALYGKGEVGVQALQWEQLGPFNVGGRTRALAFDIANPDNILAGAVSGGMWRTVDGGESWVKTTAPNDVQSASCIVQDKRAGSTAVWYYGTGELLSTTTRRVDTIPRTLATGNGIFRSIDNGASWEHLASTKGGLDGRLDEFFQGVWNIAVDNSNTTESEVYAACYGAVMRSLDAGETWSVAMGDAAKKAFNTEVALSTTGVVYAGLGSLRDTTPSPKQGIWRSPDGIAWHNITPTGFPIHVRRIKFALAPSNERVMYVLTETPIPLSERDGFTSSQHTLWKYTYLSGDGTGEGGLWTNLTSTLPENGRFGSPYMDFVNGLNTLGGYCMALAVRPDNENTVFIGGTNLFRSTDGLSTVKGLMKIGGYPPTWEDDKLHPDIHALVFHPTNPEVLLVGGDGGITYTRANRVDDVPWSPRNNGYFSTQFYSVALDPIEGGYWVIGGLQDNGTFGIDTRDNARSWRLLMGGDGMGCAIGNNGNMYVTAQSGSLLNVQGGTGIFKTLDKPKQLSADHFNFATLLALEPVERKVMYLPAKNRLWRHNDLTNLPDKWTDADPMWQELISIRTGGASIVALGASVQPMGRLYIGTNNGRILRINNALAGNPTAIDVTGDDFPVKGFVSSISVDPTDADRVLVAFSNYNVQSLFYTVNGGATWDAVGGNLEGNPDGGGAGPSVHCVRIVPIAGGTLYLAGTTVGLFSTANLAGTQTVWAQEGATVIGNVQVEAIDARLSDGRIVVATYGNGVFASNAVPTSVQEQHVPTAVYLEQNYPNPVREKTRIRFYLPAPRAVEMALYNVLGERVLVLAECEYPAGVHEVEFSAREHNLPAGMYFFRLQAGSSIQTRSLTVVR